MVGQATARLMRSSDLIETVVPKLEREPLLFLCAADAGCQDCDAARRSVTTKGDEGVQFPRTTRQP